MVIRKKVRQLSCYGNAKPLPGRKMLTQGHIFLFCRIETSTEYAKLNVLGRLNILAGGPGTLVNPFLFFFLR